LACDFPPLFLFLFEAYFQNVGGSNGKEKKKKKKLPPSLTVLLKKRYIEMAWPTR
jgi:hypothetical protein